MKTLKPFVDTIKPDQKYILDRYMANPPSPTWNEQREPKTQSRFFSQEKTEVTTLNKWTI
jgi:hypothetical protein